LPRSRLAPGDHGAWGLLNVIQRSSGDLRLNPHMHVVALDGSYVAGPDGQPAFRPLGRLKTDEVADGLAPCRQEGGVAEQSKSIAHPETWKAVSETTSSETVKTIKTSSWFRVLGTLDLGRFGNGPILARNDAPPAVLGEGELGEQRL